MLTLTVRDYHPRSAMAPHYHAELSLIVVVSGGYVERIRGTTVEHGAGHMLWYPAGAIHSQQFGAAGARKIVFTPEPSSLEYLRDRGAPLDEPRYVEAPSFSALAHRVLAEVQAADQFTALALEGLALELVAAFARRDRPPVTAAPPAWVRAARDAIGESADEKLTLQDIATLVGKHPVHLAREFRRYFGVTIGAYKRQLRLGRAEAMLRTSVSLTDVAMACGFASQSHFCRSFKAAYGVTASQFRTQGGDP